LHFANSFTFETLLKGGPSMDRASDDGYLVFIRVDGPHLWAPEATEVPLAECDSYEEARRVKRDSARDCVIRFNGDVGGGD
jgi:hypothetical protein